MNKRINKLRKALGLTLEKFGKRLGVGKSVLSQIENGHCNVTDQMFKSICREFNVNEEWLRDGTGDMFRLPDDETAALVSDLLEDADDDFYGMVLDVVRTYQQLQPESQEVFKIFCRQMKDNIKNRKEN